MTEVSFEVSDTISDQDLKVLEDGLFAHYAAMKAPALAFTTLSILNRNEQGLVIAGLHGKSFWNWLHIDSLWVDAPLRGQGLGRALLAQAEEEAKKRGCIAVYLWTQSFAAPWFYAKLGYEEFLVGNDFPLGHKRFGFRKNLVGDCK